MNELEKKRELIWERERIFANAVGAAVIEKPKVTFWMVLVPVLFLYFIYRMQKYKTGRAKFDEDFLATRRRALDLAMETMGSDGTVNLEQAVRQWGVSDELAKPYSTWLRALVDHYLDLLTAEGDSYKTLVRRAYGTRINYLLTLNRLSAVEADFYSAIKPGLSSAEGAADIIAAIEQASQRLRRDLAEEVFA